MSFLRQSSAAPVAVAPASAAAPASTPQYTGLQIQTSSSALPIPIIYGTNRLAPNLIWSDNFKANPQYSYDSVPTVHSSGSGGGKGSGGSGVTTYTTYRRRRTIAGYTYSTALVFALCEGPIVGVGPVYRNRGADTTAAAGLDILAGTTPQAPWSYLAASFPSVALGYQGTALAVTSQFDLGSSASIGTISFQVIGRLAGSAAVNGFDADPASIILDLLTNPQLGAGFPAASIDTTSLFGVSGGAGYQIYCKAMGLALSPCLSDQEAVNSILSRWLQLTNSAAIWSAGRLKFISFGDGIATAGGVTFQPDATPVYDLGDDDFVSDAASDPVVVTRADPYGASNVQSLEILDRANQYSATSIEARDQGAVEQTGLRAAPTITAHEICDTAVASVAAQLILQRRLYVRNTYAFKLSWECCLLEPMDIVTLTDAGLGLARTPVRILAIGEDDNGLLSVTAEEYPGQVGTTTGYPVSGASNPGSIDRSAVPAAVNPPVILEPPTGLTQGTPQIWVGLSGGSAGVADPNWGGAAIYASADNATYLQVGATTGAASQGVLTAVLGAPPGSPSDTLAVNFAQSGTAIASVAGPTLIAVDGEILSFSSATLVAANVYSLGGLQRAVYGNRGGAHAAGAKALILDGAVFSYTLPQTSIGQPLWFKFASYNTFGQKLQDLATCTAYAFTPVGSGYLGPVAQAIGAGQSFDEGMASSIVTSSDTYGLCSDPYFDTFDMGLASEAATALAVQSGGTGAASASAARVNIGAAASGANGDITGLSALTAATIGKSAAGDTGALTYLSGGTARASAGLLASDRYRVSVSPAGSGFRQALDVDPATGNVGLAGYTADASNALGVLGGACLFAAAADSMRFTFSKVAAANDASLSFQTSFSARALAGLLGSDDWQLKVSPDGSTYYQVVVADRTNGNAAFKALIGTASYAVASLPAGFNGAMAFATNGRQPGEAVGAGTGVIVAFSNGQWRRLSDGTIAAA